MKYRNCVLVACLACLLILLCMIVVARYGQGELPETEPPLASAAVPVQPTPEPTPEPTPTPTPEPMPEPTPEPEPEIVVNENDAVLIAKTLKGECEGCSPVEQAAVAWCILNRVDAEGWAFGRSVEYVTTFPDQFHGYNPNNPVVPELYEMAVDVLTRWEREKRGETDVGRVLPPEFRWFRGDGKHNYFRDAYDGSYTVWDWSLQDPYIEKD